MSNYTETLSHALIKRERILVHVFQRFRDTTKDLIAINRNKRRGRQLYNRRKFRYFSRSFCPVYRSVTFEVARELYGHSFTQREGQWLYNLDIDIGRTGENEGAELCPDDKNWRAASACMNTDVILMWNTFQTTDVFSMFNVKFQSPSNCVSIAKKNHVELPCLESIVLRDELLCWAQEISSTLKSLNADGIFRMYVICKWFNICHIIAYKITWSVVRSLKLL